MKYPFEKFKEVRNSSVSILLLFLVFLLSCERGPIDSSPQTNSRPITVEEARTWFEEKILPQSNARIASNDKVKKSAGWVDARQVKNKDGIDMVLVPVTYDDYGMIPNVEIKGATTTEQTLLNRTHLLVYKDEKGNNIADVIEVIPSENYLNNSERIVKEENFEGLLLVRDWDGNLIRGFKYYDGKIQGITKEKKNAKGGRLMDAPILECVTVTTYVCPMECYPVVCSSCNVTSSDSFCMVSTTGGGGGGGGSADGSITYPIPSSGATPFPQGHLKPESFKWKRVTSNWRATEVSCMYFARVDMGTSAVRGVEFQMEVGMPINHSEVGYVSDALATQLATTAANIVAMDVQASPHLFDGPNFEQNVKNYFKERYQNTMSSRLSGVRVNIPPITPNIPNTCARFSSRP